MHLQFKREARQAFESWLGTVASAASTLSASIGVYRAQAKSNDGVFDGKSLASRQEIQSVRALTRAGDN